MSAVAAKDQGPILSPREVLQNLGIDEKSLDELVASTGVEVSEDEVPVSRVIAADVLLASIFAADLPQEVDFAAVLDLLTITNDAAFAQAMPELTTKLLALANDEQPASGAQAYLERMRMARDAIFGIQATAP